ncbi:metal ABC transporter permease [Mollicutes bacterium LVI A0039]|nr:metal ABC transporter permease [Mollicutes bacterium LVI A0039]
MIDLLSYELFRNGLYVAIVIGALLPIVGVIVLLRRMTFIADSFGHINMAGIALAILISSIFPALAGFTSIITILWTIGAALLIEYLRDKYSDYKELSITIVYSISIALMMIFLSLSGGYNSSLFAVLFGNINGISTSDLYSVLINSAIILVIVALNYKKILLLALEEDYAKLYNVNIKRIKYLMMVLIALSITIAIKAIGVLLVSSLIIIPLIAASNISKNLKATVLWAILFTEISMIVGMFSSFYLNLPTSAIIVLISIIIYLISIPFKQA